MELEYKNLASEIKADDTGVITGFASTSSLDSDKDRVFASAFKETLDRASGQFSLCWQHDIKNPIGLATLELGKDRIPIRGELYLDMLNGQKCVEKAYEAYALSKNAERMRGDKKPGFSIGFRTMQSKGNKEGGRDITKIELYEVSIVTIPANIEAAINTVKQFGDYDDFYEGFYNWLQEKRLLNGGAFKKVTPAESQLEKITRILSGG